MILFVNGFTMGCEPFRPYWSSSSKNPSEFIDAACAYFQDDRVLPQSFINGSGDWFGSMAWSRQASGRNFAIANLIHIQKLLNENEVVHILSHSMGAAYAEGIIEILDANRISLGKIIHLAPADARNIKIKNPALSRVQLNATGDYVLEKIANPFSKEEKLIIPKIDVYGRVNWDPWRYHFKHMIHLKEKQLAFNLDAHFDLKTYAFVFDWLKDLEATPNPLSLGKRKNGDTIFSIPFSTSKTRFQNYYFKGMYFSFIEPFEEGKSDKFSVKNI